jgi:hypothetical protein
MAIIGEGEVLIAGNPAEIEKHLQGKIFEKEIEKEQVENYRKEFNVIAQNFHLGKIHLTIFSETDPKDGFSLKETSLEDTYFNLIANQKKVAENV